ncbi:MAG: DUF1415 family protein [Gammaproteobacteria bacterium]|nr:DUF1415 family protein [Gammaproteobacteria bacterium]
MSLCCIELDNNTAKQLETTLLIVSDTNIPIKSDYLGDFYDYLEALAIANDFLDNPQLFASEFSCEFQDKFSQKIPQSWSENYQLASFHPEYQFENTDSNERQNYTNRSPYPIFHIIRNESIEHVRMNDDKALEIVDRNIDTLHNLSDDAFQILQNLAHPSQK